MSISTESDVRRISISLTGNASLVVQDLSQRFNLSEGDTVRRAISVLAEIVAEEERGAKLMIREPDSETPVLLKIVYS